MAAPKKHTSHKPTGKRGSQVRVNVRSTPTAASNQQTPARTVRQVTSAPSQLRQPLQVNGSNMVKTEFMIGIVLILLAPLANTTIKMDKTFVRHIVGWMVIFMFLFPMSGSRNSGVVKAANGLGGMLLLVISLKGTNSGFGVDVPNLLKVIAGKISGSGDTASAGIGVNGPLGGPVDTSGGGIGVNGPLGGPVGGGIGVNGPLGGPVGGGIGVNGPLGGPVDGAFGGIVNGG